MQEVEIYKFTILKITIFVTVTLKGGTLRFEGYFSKQLLNCNSNMYPPPPHFNDVVCAGTSATECNTKRLEIKGQF